VRPASTSVDGPRRSPQARSSPPAASSRRCPPSRSRPSCSRSARPLSQPTSLAGPVRCFFSTSWWAPSSSAALVLRSPRLSRIRMPPSPWFWQSSCRSASSQAFLSQSWSYPTWLIDIGKVFPVHALADALLAAYNPHAVGSGPNWGDLAVLAAWGIAALVVATRRFSWLPHSTWGQLTRVSTRTLVEGMYAALLPAVRRRWPPSTPPRARASGAFEL